MRVRNRWLLDLLVLIIGQDNFKVFCEVGGLSFNTEPNRTIVALTGSNLTFKWSLNLTAEEKKKEMWASFGEWDISDHDISQLLLRIVRGSSGKETIIRPNPSAVARRLVWTGDLSHNYYASFLLMNVQRTDKGSYGLDFKVRLGSPPREKEGIFALSVKDQPVKPIADTNNISLEVKEGKSLNISCRIIMEGNRPNVVWMRDKILVHTGQSKFLFLERVNRSQAGNYVCISLSATGNRTSPITAVYVLCEYMIPTISQSYVLIVTAPVTVTVTVTMEVTVALIVIMPVTVTVTVTEAVTMAVAGAVTATVTVTVAVTMAVAGAVTATVTVTVTVAVTMAVTVPRITSRRQGEVIVPEGYDLHLRCQAEGAPTPLLTWRRNGEIVQNRTIDTDFMRGNASRDDEGVYECKASNSIGSDSYIVVVKITGTEAVVSKAERRRGVIIGIVLTVVILCIVFIVVFCYRRRLRDLCGGTAERRAAKDGNSSFKEMERLAEKNLTVENIHA